MEAIQGKLMRRNFFSALFASVAALVLPKAVGAAVAPKAPAKGTASISEDDILIQDAMVILGVLKVGSSASPAQLELGRRTLARQRQTFGEYFIKAGEASILADALTPYYWYGYKQDGHLFYKPILKGWATGTTLKPGGKITIASVNLD
jgi:hypothetical protein